MTKAIIALVAALALAMPAAAQDFWVKKPYSEWDEKEVQRVLFDSPWARRVTVEVNWAGGTMGRPRPTDEQRGAPTIPGESPTEGGPPAGVGALEGATQIRRPQTQFILRWSSSEATRKAMVRSIQLQGRSPEGDVEQYVSAELPYYEVTVVGQDMTPFADAGEEAVRSRSTLKPRGQRQATEAEAVAFHRDPASERIVAVSIRFPRTTEAGGELIAADERHADFFTQAGPLVLRTRFDLRKMVGPDGLDY